MEKIIPIITDRVSKWEDIDEMLKNKELDFFYKSPVLDKNKLVYKDTSVEQTSKNISKAYKELEKIEEKDFNSEKIKEILMKLADDCKNRGEILHPIRYALSGLEKSPDPFIISDVLGKNETLLRLQKAI